MKSFPRRPVQSEAERSLSRKAWFSFYNTCATGMNEYRTNNNENTKRGSTFQRFHRNWRFWMHCSKALAQYQAKIQNKEKYDDRRTAMVKLKIVQNVHIICRLATSISNLHKYQQQERPDHDSMTHLLTTSCCPKHLNLSREVDRTRRTTTVSCCSTCTTPLRDRRT